MIRIDRRIIVTALALSVCAKASAQQPTPSCDSAVYRQLDFWVGTWDVRLDGSDTVIGTNIIEKTLNSCAVLEHWSDARGSRGKSLFYYHPADKVWKQEWVEANSTIRAGSIETTRIVRP
jgi:hypothetical protein